MTSDRNKAVFVDSSEYRQFRNVEEPMFPFLTD